MKPVKSCFYCKNALINKGSPMTRHDPGEPPMAECKLAADQNGKILNKKLYTLGERLEWHEEKMPAKCGHFDPTLIEKCSCCGKIINSPEYSHSIFAYEYMSGESVSVCSDKCKKDFETKSKADADHHDKMMEDYAKAMENTCKINVLLLCTNRMVKEDTVTIENIEEDFQGRDVVTFACPNCKQNHKSLRYGG